jgi:hypothetical protein
MRLKDGTKGKRRDAKNEGRLSRTVKDRRGRENPWVRQDGTNFSPCVSTSYSCGPWWFTVTPPYADIDNVEMCPYYIPPLKSPCWGCPTYRGLRSDITEQNYKSWRWDLAYSFPCYVRSGGTENDWVPTSYSQTVTFSSSTTEKTSHCNGRF